MVNVEEQDAKGDLFYFIFFFFACQIRDKPSFLNLVLISPRAGEVGGTPLSLSFMQHFAQGLPQALPLSYSLL